MIREGTITDLLFPSKELVFKWLKYSIRERGVIPFKNGLQAWFNDNNMSFMTPWIKREDVVGGEYTPENNVLILSMPFRDAKAEYMLVYSTIMHELIHAVTFLVSNNNKMKQRYTDPSSFATDIRALMGNLIPAKIQYVKYAFQETESNPVAYQTARIAYEKSNEDPNLVKLSPYEAADKFKIKTIIMDAAPLIPEIWQHLNKTQQRWIIVNKKRFEKRYFDVLNHLISGGHKGQAMRWNEGRKSALAILKNRFGTDEYIEQVIDIDPTPQKKYAEWIAKQVIKFGQKYTDLNELEALGTMIVQFHDLLEKGKIPEDFRNINVIDDPEMLEDIVYQAEQTTKGDSGYTKAEEATIKSNETNTIVDNEQVSVVEPMTHRSWCFWVPNKWCTSYKSDKAKEVVDQQHQHGIRSFVIIDHTKEEGDRTKYVSVSRYPQSMRVPKGDEFAEHMRGQQERLRAMGHTEEEALAHFQSYDIPDDLEEAQFEITYGDNKQSSLAGTIEDVIEALQPHYNFRLREDWF